MALRRHRPTPAGFRNTLITIQTETETNTKGEITRAWANTTKRWAMVEPLQSSEQFEGDRVQGRNVYRVTMPFTDILTKDDRLTFVEKGVTKTLNIRGITNPMGLNREHVCECVEEL